jgi:hypothetical protein
MPTLLAFPMAKVKPTDHFDLRVPRADDDSNVSIDYYRPDEACMAHAQADQTILFAPDGSAFVFRVTPLSASSSSATFGA